MDVEHHKRMAKKVRYLGLTKSDSSLVERYMSMNICECVCVQYECVRELYSTQLLYKQSQ